MNYSQKLIEIHHTISKSDKKTIHFRSLSNFVEYYPIAKKERGRITELLDDYFVLIEDRKWKLSKVESEAAFNMYIAVLGNKYYSKHLGFTNYLGILAVLLFVAVNLIVWAVAESQLVLFLVLFVTSCMMVNYLVKIAKHKVYGFRY